MRRTAPLVRILLLLLSVLNSAGDETITTLSLLVPLIIWLVLDWLMDRG
jgi:hypothetical protein